MTIGRVGSGPQTVPDAAARAEGMTRMPADETDTSGAGSGMFQEFFGQLRATTERLQQLAQAGGPFRPAFDVPPLPGALSAAQMTAITDTIAAQRRSIAALQAQLGTFDEQLAVLEQVLGPLADWSRTWADLEQRLLNLKPKP